MATAIISGIVALLGIVSTLIAYNLNPKKVLATKLAEIDKQIKEWGVKRDEALLKGDVDNLTIANYSITQLLQTRSNLLQ